MTILLGNNVLDNGLTYLQSKANRVALCSAQPTSFANVSLVLLGSATPGPGGVFTGPVNALPNGRQVSSNVVTGTVTQGGTGTYMAVVDDTDAVLLLTASIDIPQTVSIGFGWQLASFNVAIGSGAMLLLQPTSLTVSAPTLGTPALSTQIPPVVQNATFNPVEPVTNGQVIGTMTATNSPTAWSINTGNTLGYFAIANSGAVSVTAAGAAGLTSAQNFSLGVQASNSAGLGSGTTTINVAASGSLPSGVSLQAIDGETMTGTTMSHNYYTNGGFTYVTNNPSYPGMSWDHQNTFPVLIFFGTYSGDISTFQSLKCNNPATTSFAGTSLAVTGPNDWGGGAGNFTPLITGQILGIPSEGDIPATSWGNWTPAFHVDDNVSTPADLQSFVNSYGAGNTNRMFSQVLGHSFIKAPGLGTGASFQNSAQLLSLNNFTSPVSPGHRSIDFFGCDFYWFAVSQDVNAPASGANQAGGFFAVPMVTGGAPAATTDQMARGSNYGNMIDTFRSFGNGTNTGPGSSAFGLSAAASRLPFNAFIENGDGKWTEQAILITPPQLNWAVWSSIIHGVRAITYFTDSSTAHGEGFRTSIQSGQSISIFNQAVATNQLIDNLASVINSPFAKGYMTAVSPHGYIFPVYEQNWLNGGIECCVHWYQGGTYTPSVGPLSGVAITNGFYIFSGTRNSATAGSVTATFTINHGHQPTNITVLGEGRTITSFTNLGGGSFSFTDTFATSATVHIYQVVG